MTVVREGSVCSDRSVEPVSATGIGGLGRHPGRFGRVVTALGVVLAVLMGALTTSVSPVAATGGPSHSVLATVTVGSFPVGVAVSPDGSRVYVANQEGGSVSVINTSNNTVVATVTGLLGPVGVAVSPDGSRVYVTNNGAGSVSVINTSNNTVVATVTVGVFPVGVAVSPDGSRVYVANIGGNSVSVINTSNNTVVATVTVGIGATGVAVSPDGSRVYVPNVGGGSVSVINTSNNTVVATVTVGSGPYGVAVSPDGSRVYVTNNGRSNSVSVINTSNNTVVATVTGLLGPSGVAVSPDGSRVYVANQGLDSVSVINTSNNTVVDTVTVGIGATGVAVSPDGSRVYVANQGGGSVSVVSAPASVTTPSAPTALAATPGNGSASIAFTPGADGGAAITKYQYQLGSGSWTDAVGTTSPISISGLTNGTNSSIKLRAVNSAGDGAASDAVSVTPRTVPSAPTSLVATPGDSSVSVAFTAGADGGAAISKYQYQLGSGSWTDAVGTTSPISISGLTNGTNYSIKLRAVNSAGNGAGSDSVSVTPRTVSSAPTSLVATPGDGSASIAFSAGADGGAAITKYQYKVGSGAWTDAVGTTSPITITGLTNYQVSRIRLRAVNAAGDGAASDPVQVWPRIPGSALNLLKAQSSSRVLASVSALNPVGGTVSHYWFTAYAKGTNTVVATCRAAADVRSCVFLGLLANTEYDVSARGFFTLTGSADVLQTLDSATQTVRTKN